MDGGSTVDLLNGTESDRGVNPIRSNERPPAADNRTHSQAEQQCKTNTIQVTN